MTEFIARNYGQKEFEVIIKTDRKDLYKSAEDFARMLIDHAKPQTNFDRIRAMSDEELRSFLADRGCPTDDCYLVYPCPDATACRSCWLKWLNQPVEPTDDGGTPR